jgi:hypothetical protein
MYALISTGIFSKNTCFENSKVLAFKPSESDQNHFVRVLVYLTIALHFCLSVSTQDKANSLKSSKNSSSSDISPLNNGTLFNPGPGMALIPLLVVNMLAEFVNNDSWGGSVVCGIER